MTAVIPYGPAITDALQRPDAGLDELIALREHARAILKGQGDLRDALQRLEREIEQRQGRR